MEKMNQQPKQNVRMMVDHSLRMNMKSLEALLTDNLIGDPLTIEERIKIKALKEDMEKNCQDVGNGSLEAAYNNKKALYDEAADYLEGTIPSGHGTPSIMEKRIFKKATENETGQKQISPTGKGHPEMEGQ